MHREQRQRGMKEDGRGWKKMEEKREEGREREREKEKRPNE
jgi:hypothetical protein